MNIQSTGNTRKKRKDMKKYKIWNKLATDSKKNMHFLAIKSNSRVKAEQIAQVRINEPCRIISVIEGKGNI